MPASFRYLTDKRFRLNSLLAKWRDGKYYTAHVVKSNIESKKCLVRFEDGSEHWLQSRDIHVQLSYDNIDLEEDLVCSMCDDGKSELPNVIVLCDICQQGYHQKCHIPPVEDSKLDVSDSDKHQDWMCSTCYYILNQSRTLGSSSNSLKPSTSASMVDVAPSKKISGLNDFKQTTRNSSPSNNNTNIKKDNLVNIKNSNNYEASGRASSSGTGDGKLVNNDTKNSHILPKNAAKLGLRATTGAKATLPTSSNEASISKTLNGDKSTVRQATRSTKNDKNSSTATRSTPVKISPKSDTSTSSPPSSPASSTSFHTSDGSSSDDALEIVTKPSPVSKTNEKRGRTKPNAQKASPPKVQPSRSPVKHAVRKSATNHNLPEQAPQIQDVSIKNKDCIVASTPNQELTSSSTTETKASSNRVASKTKSITAIADNLRIVSKKPKLVKTQPPQAATGAISTESNAASGTIVVVPSITVSTSTVSISSASNNNSLGPQMNKTEESRLHLVPTTCQAPQQTTPILNQNKQQQQVVSEQASTPSRETPIVENVVDQLIPRPENFEGDNNPFADLS